MPTENDLEQVAILQRIKPEKTDEYIEAHDNVPESVVDAMVEGGIHEYHLYLRDEIAVGVIEVEDLDAFQDRYKSDIENEAWEAHVDQFKREGIDPDDMEMPEMTEIWSLADERDS